MQTIQLKRIQTKIICSDKMNRNRLLREWFVFALWIVSMSCFLFRIERKKTSDSSFSFVWSNEMFIKRKVRLRWSVTHLFVGQFFAATLLANLMTLVVTARCTIAAVVFLLTTDAFTAALTLLLCLKRSKRKTHRNSVQCTSVFFRSQLWLGFRVKMWNFSLFLRNR